MKKITLFSLFLIAIVFANAQTNLVVNPGFETWTSGVPDSWAVPANSSHVGSLTVVQEQSILKSGASALRMEISTTQNPGFQQVIPITAGKNYTLSMSYYVVSGDGTDCRIWCSFKNATGFYNSAAWATAVAADATIQLKLQGDGTSTSNYFTIANGTWGTYTVDFKAPADATDFVFEGRAYKSSTVIWDDMSLVEKTSSGVSNPDAKNLNVWSSNGAVNFNATQGETVEVYNAIGQKLMTQTAVEGINSLNVENKGVTIVKIANRVGKVIL